MEPFEQLHGEAVLRARRVQDASCSCVGSVSTWPRLLRVPFTSCGYTWLSLSPKRSVPARVAAAQQSFVPPTCARAGRASRSRGQHGLLLPAQIAAPEGL